MNLANKLTISRMILVVIMVGISLFTLPGNIPLLPFMDKIPSTQFVILIIFAVAAFTDKLDGYVARSRNEITVFGKFLDPLADKILVLSAMILLVGDGRLPALVPIIVAIREFIVSGYRLVAVENGGEVIAASFWGKLKTVTQVIAVISALLEVNAFGDVFRGTLTGVPLVLNGITMVFMIISTIATLFSGWDYLKGAKKLFNKQNERVSK